VWLLLLLLLVVVMRVAGRGRVAGVGQRGIVVVDAGEALHVLEHHVVVLFVFHFLF
jgi:hypothetical protein